MKTKALFASLTCVNFLLVRGLALESSSENSATNSSGRILHGRPAPGADFPFLVKLEISGSTGAGAIISEHWILTAGQCVYEHVCSAVMKIFPAVWPLGKSATPLACYAHPQYSDKTIGYDVGLIKVEKNLLQGRTKAIPLPAPGTLYSPGTKVVVAGWGKTEDSGRPYNTALQADFQIEEWNYCNGVHLSEYCKGDPNPNCVPVDMPKRVLCLRGEGSPASGTCLGDVGAPAVVNGVVAGIVSYRNAKGSRCRVGDPTMSTRVADFLPWIYTLVPTTIDIYGIQLEYP